MTCGWVCRPLWLYLFSLICHFCLSFCLSVSVWYLGSKTCVHSSWGIVWSDTMVHWQLGCAVERGPLLLHFNLSAGLILKVGATSSATVSHTHICFDLHSQWVFQLSFFPPKHSDKFTGLWKYLRCKCHKKEETEKSHVLFAWFIRGILSNILQDVA